jgi:hypothetical protein
MSCNKKRELFTQHKENTDNIQVKNHYKKYCTVLRNVINEAKSIFHKQVATSSNKVKTAWKIIKDNSGNSQHVDTINRIKFGNVLLETPRILQMILISSIRI